jgi:hypothetical protein
MKRRRTTTFASRRRAIASAVLCAATIVLLGGCNVTARKSPTGFLGLKWGDDSADCARRLGLTFDRWERWIDPQFETSMDIDHPQAVLGTEGLVVLVRDASSKQLVGVQVIYRDCATDAARRRQLREGLVRELNVKTDSEPPYVVWSDHSLVRLADRKDGTCALTVAGPVFGKPYADQLLHEGLGELGNAMRPH